MNQKTFNMTAGIIFSIVTVAHALRAALHWDMVIGGWAAPMGLSIAGLFIAGYLAYTAFRLNK